MAPPGDFKQMQLQQQRGYMIILMMTYKPVNYVTLTWLLICDQSSSVGLCVHDYKSPRVAIMVWATLVNTQTHTESKMINVLKFTL